MKLYLFNPDAELALASGSTHYLPPAAIRQMAADLSLLPLWYGDAGSTILLYSEEEALYLQQMKQLFALPIEGLSVSSLPTHITPSPWGWNLSIRHQCLRLGLEESFLPSVEEVEHHRLLSSREIAAAWLPVVSQGLSDCIGQMEVIRSIQACADYAAHTPHCLFKQPWSSSGKGLRWCRGHYGAEDEHWCHKAISTQGCVVASPIYKKVCDLAMEFRRSDKSRVEFVGYSLFLTNERGVYLGNRLITDSTAENILQQWLSLDVLYEVRRRWIEQLSCLDDACMEYVGVDMMVCDVAGSYRLHPCIEVNLRMNMGVLASIFARRYLNNEAECTLRIEGFRTSKALLETHCMWQKSHPWVVKDGRLVSGYLPLVPVTPHSRMLAYVWA